MVNIENSKVKLVRWNAADETHVQGYLAVMGDAHTASHLGLTLVSDKEEAREAVKEWGETPYAYAVELRKTGEIIGFMSSVDDNDYRSAIVKEHLGAGYSNEMLDLFAEKKADRVEVVRWDASKQEHVDGFLRIMGEESNKKGDSLAETAEGALFPLIYNEDEARKEVSDWSQTDDAYAITLPSGKVIGFLSGLNDVGNSGNGQSQQPEHLRYALDPDYRGKGYVVDAIEVLAKELFRNGAKGISAFRMIDSFGTSQEDDAETAYPAHNDTVFATSERILREAGFKLCRDIDMGYGTASYLTRDDFKAKEGATAAKEQRKPRGNSGVLAPARTAATAAVAVADEQPLTPAVPKTSAAKVRTAAKPSGEKSPKKSFLKAAFSLLVPDFTRKR